MKKIVTILGARPQFIKAAVLSRIIAEENNFKEVIVHTGQHYDTNMSAVFFDEMNIPKPKYNLAVNGLSHGAMTGQMLIKIEEVLLIEKPDLVIVYGDTNSTLAGALAAKKMHIKIAHIEAGLRSFNMHMPEEINRILTDRISDFLFCPTSKAADNLQMEGFNNFTAQLIHCGDIMGDAVKYYSQFSAQKSNIINTLKLKNDSFILATIHRQENTDCVENLQSIFEALNSINKNIKVVIPLHPRTKIMLEKHKIKVSAKIIDPVGYFDMLELLKNCNLVITDSGGLQKEAFFNKKHCIIVREETEWIELVTNGFALISGSKSEQILKAFNQLQHKNSKFSLNLYGNNVGKAIHKELVKNL